MASSTEKTKIKAAAAAAAQAFSCSHFFLSLVALIRTRTDCTVVFYFLLLSLPFSLFGGSFCSLLLSTRFVTIKNCFGLNSQLLLDLAAAAVEVEGAAVVVIVSGNRDLYHSACLLARPRLHPHKKEGRSGREHLAKGAIPSRALPLHKTKAPSELPFISSHTHTLSLFFHMTQHPPHVPAPLFWYCSK